MLYRIVKIEDENIFLQRVAGLSVSGLTELDSSKEALGREFGFRYGECEGQYFAAGTFSERLYQSADKTLYLHIEDEILLQDKFTWLDEEEEYDFRVPQDKFHIFIEIDQTRGIV